MKKRIVMLTTLLVGLNFVFGGVATYAEDEILAKNLGKYVDGYKSDLIEEQLYDVEEVIIEDNEKTVDLEIDTKDDLDIAGASTSWAPIGSGVTDGVHWEVDSERNLTLTGTQTSENPFNFHYTDGGSLHPLIWKDVNNVYVNYKPNKSCKDLFAYNNIRGNITFGSNFDTSSVTDMSGMFSGLNITSLSIPDSIDTSNVTDMSYMFKDCLDLTSLEFGSGFNTSRVTNMEGMFHGCSIIKSFDLSKFNTENVESMKDMFSTCNELQTLDLSSFNTSKVTDMSYMFNQCNKLETLNLGNNFDTSSVTDLSGTFMACSSLTKLDLKNKFDTSNVTTFNSTFCGLRSVKNLDLGENFNTEKSIYFLQMFRDCTSLESVNLGNKFNTSKGLDFFCMFYDDAKLKSLNLGDNFDMSNGYQFQAMFYGCTQLKTIANPMKFNITTGPVKYKNKNNNYEPWTVLGMFGGCKSLESLDLSEMDLTYMEKDFIDNIYNPMFSADTNLKYIKTPKKIGRYYPALARTLYENGDRAKPHTRLDIENTELYVDEAFVLSIDTSNVVCDIIGRGRGCVSFTLQDAGKVLKNQKIKYYFIHNGVNSVNTKTSVQEATSDRDGIITIWTNGFSENRTNATIVEKWEAHLYKDGDDEANELDIHPVLNVNVHPIAFTQEWNLNSQASISGSVGEKAGLTFGPLELEAKAAEASISGEAGNKFGIIRDYNSGKNDIYLYQEMGAKAGLAGSIGPDVKAKIGYNYEATLGKANAGVGLGATRKIGQSVPDYDPEHPTKDQMLTIGGFLFTANALGQNNISLFSLGRRVLTEVVLKDKFYEDAGVGTNLTVKGGVNIGNLEIYKGEANEGGGVDKTTILEGSIEKLEYNSVYEAMYETNKNTSNKIKSMKKTSSLDFGMGNITNNITGSSGSIFAKSLFPKNYSLSTDSKELTVKELTGLGLVNKERDEGNLFNIDSAFLKHSVEENDVVHYSEANANKLTAKNRPLEKFVKGNSFFFLDSAMMNFNEGLIHSGVKADYYREKEDKNVFCIPLKLGLMLGLGLDFDVSTAGTSSLTSVKQSGIYTYIDNSEDESAEFDYDGYAVSTAVNDNEEMIAAKKMSIVKLIESPVNYFKEETDSPKYKAETRGSIFDGIADGFCRVWSTIDKGVDLVREIIITVVKDENYNASHGGHGTFGMVGGANGDSVPFSYRVEVDKQSEGLVGAANDMPSTAVTLGCAYNIAMMEDGGYLAGFEDSPINIALEYSDEMLSEAGANEADERTIKIYRYVSENCCYRSVESTIDVDNNIVTAKNITKAGQYILAIPEIGRNGGGSGSGTDDNSGTDADLEGDNNLNNKEDQAEKVENELAVKQKLQFSSAMFNTTKKIAKYEVSNKSVASINKKGLLKAKKSGTVTVTAFEQTGKKSYAPVGTYEIVIKQPSVKPINASAAGQKFSVSDYLSNAPQVSKYEIKAGKSPVAKVDPKTGEVIILGKGKTKLTLYFGEGKNASKYTVKIFAKF